MHRVNICVSTNISPSTHPQNLSVLTRAAAGFLWPGASCEVPVLGAGCGYEATIDLFAGHWNPLLSQVIYWAFRSQKTINCAEGEQVIAISQNHSCLNLSQSPYYRLQWTWLDQILNYISLEITCFTLARTSDMLSKTWGTLYACAHILTGLNLSNSVVNGMFRSTYPETNLTFPQLLLRLSPGHGFQMRFLGP